MPSCNLRIPQGNLSGLEQRYLPIDRTVFLRQVLMRRSPAPGEVLCVVQCRFHHSDARAGTLRPGKSFQLEGQFSREGDHDPSDMRRSGAQLLFCACICRNLCCFSLWLRRRPDRIGREDESRRDDRGASRQTIRLSGHCHFTFNRPQRHRPDK